MNICFLSATLPITSCLLHNLILTNIFWESQRCAKANWSLLKGSGRVCIFLIPFSGMSCQELKMGSAKSSYVAKTRRAAADQRWLVLVNGNVAGGFLSPLFTRALRGSEKQRACTHWHLCDKQFHWDLHLCLHGSNVYVSHHHCVLLSFSLATAQFTVSWNVENVLLYYVTRKCIIFNSPSSYIFKSWCLPWTSLQNSSFTCILLICNKMNFNQFNVNKIAKTKVTGSSTCILLLNFFVKLLLYRT